MMKKKFGMILVFLGIFLLTSCIEVANVDDIVFESMPKTTYLVGEELEEFTVRITFLDDTEDLVISSYDSRLEIRGFDTTTPGTKTLNVTYEDVSVSIVYTVTTLYAGGTGTQGDPYEIATAYHFMNIFTQNSAGFNYKLTDDIDFSQVTLEQYNYHINNASVNPFRGTIDGEKQDGGRFKIMNYDHIESPFGHKIGSSTISNIDFANITVYYTSTKVTGGVIAYNFINGSDITISDISVDDESRTHTGGFFAETAGLTQPTSITFENIEFHGLVTGHLWAASLIGYGYGNLDITVRNTTNYGTMIGARADTAAFFGKLTKTVSVSFENVENHGDLYFLGAVGALNPFIGINQTTLVTMSGATNYGNAYLGKSHTEEWNDMSDMITIDDSDGNSTIHRTLEQIGEPSLNAGYISFDGIEGAAYYEVAVEVRVDKYRMNPADLVYHLDGTGYPRYMNKKTVEQPNDFDPETPNIDTSFKEISSVKQKTNVVSVVNYEGETLTIDPSLIAAEDAVIGLSADESSYIWDPSTSTEDTIYLLIASRGYDHYVRYLVTAFNSDGLPISYKDKTFNLD
jgi:hypothetical protein